MHQSLYPHRRDQARKTARGEAPGSLHEEKKEAYADMVTWHSLTMMSANEQRPQPGMVTRECPAMQETGQEESEFKASLDNLARLS